jgi:hypothetical protein
MEKAGPGELLVETETWAETAGHVRQIGRPALQRLKGGREPVEVHAVQGWRRSHARTTSVAYPPLVGRGAEMEEVERLLDSINAGDGSVLVLEGDPGLGKTRLVQEAFDRARARGYRVVMTDVDDHPRGQSQGTWRDLVGGVVGTPGRGSIKQWLEALSTMLPDVGGHFGVLGPLLGLRLGASATGEGSPRPGAAHPAELAQGLLARLLSVAGSQRPLLVVVENADHLDQGSLQIVAGLATSLSGSRAGILLTQTSAHDGIPDGTVHVGTRVLPLTELQPVEAAVVAADAWREVDGGSPPPWLADLVNQCAGGNPLYTRVVTSTIREQWAPGYPRPADAVATGPLTGMLTERIDRLSRAHREFLNLLAVANRPCGPKLVTGVLADLIDERSARGIAAQLARKRLIRVDTRAADERYALVHDVLRQVVYETMSHADRHRLHRELVDFLSHVGADPVEIAEHVQYLDDPALMQRWLPIAAAYARRSWNLPAAATFLQRVRPLLTGPTHERIEVELLEVLLVAGRTNEVLSQAVKPDDAPASPIVDERSTVAASPADPVLAARRLHAIAEAAFVCGQYGRSETAAREAMHLTDGLDEARYQRAAELLVLVGCERGEMQGAVVAAEALVERALAAADARAVTTARAALGAALLLSGRPEEAALQYEKALVLARANEDVVQQIHIVSDLAGCAFESGQHVECVELLADARKRADSIGYRRHLAFSLGNEAQLRAMVADPYATSCAAVSVQRSLEMGDLPAAADTLHTWLTAKPALAASMDHWRRLADIDTGLSRALAAATDHADLAVVAARAGRRQDALRAADLAVGAAQQLNQPQLLRRATLARLLAEFHGAARRTQAQQSSFLEGLKELSNDEDAGEIERAEIGLERWRATRTAADHTSAVELATQAFAVEPSATVRQWFNELKTPIPDPPAPLPPPVGISSSRTTHAQLTDAFSRLEAALQIGGTPNAVTRT